MTSFNLCARLNRLKFILLRMKLQSSINFTSAFPLLKEELKKAKTISLNLSENVDSV
jgi:hypothetical protein